MGSGGRPRLVLKRPVSSLEASRLKALRPWWCWVWSSAGRQVWEAGSEAAGRVRSSRSLRRRPKEGGNAGGV